MNFLNVFSTMLFAAALSVLVSCSDHIDVNKSIEIAEQHSSSGEYRTAIIELKKLLQTDKNNKKARYLLGNIYLVLGDGVNAEKEFKWARKLGLEKKDLAFQIGRSLLLQNKYQDLLDTLLLDSAVTSSKKALMLVLHGEAFLGMNELDKAHDAFAAAAALDSGLSSPFVGNAKVSIRQGKLDEAKAYLDKAKKITANDKDALIVRAEISKLKGDFQQAERILNRALKQDKAKNITAYKFRVLTELVVVQISQGKLDVASTGIKTLAESFPKHSYIKYLQGWLAFQKQKYETANTELLELQKQAPGFLPGILLLGATSYALGNYEQANIYLSRFVNKAPTHSYGRKLLAATQLKLNLPEKAMETLQSDVKTKDAELIAMMGQAAALTGNTDVHADYLRNVIKDNPDNLLLRKELAKTYIRQGDLKDAITELQFLHSKNRQDRSADLLLIYTQLRAGNINSARNLAQKILQNKPSDPNLQAVMGDVDLVAGKRDMARQHFHEALKLQKTHIYSQLSLARMELDDGNLIAADKWFDKVLSENNASVAALLGRAQIALRQGKVDEALSFLEKARTADAQAVLPRVILARYYLSTGKTDLALELANEVNALEPGSATSLLLLGRARLQAKQPQNAADAYQKLVSKQPSATAYFELAVAQRALGDLDSVRISLKKSLQKNAKYLKAKVMLVELELNSKQYAKALKLINEIKRQYSDKNIGYRLEADIYMREKRYKDAQKAFQIAIKQEPKADLFVKLSRACYLAGDTAKALITLNKGLARYQNNTVLRLALATYYQLAGNTVLAEKNYKKLLEQQPSNIVVLNNMASLLADKNPEKALSYARQAYRLAPQSMAVTDTFGWLLINQKQIKEGLKLLTQAVSLGNNPTVKYHLAFALVKNGKKEEARAILGRLVKSGIKFPEQGEALTLLTRLQ